MKKWIITFAAFVLLAGCAQQMPDDLWQRSSHLQLSNWTIGLKSSLWTDMVPIDKEDSDGPQVKHLTGSLELSSRHELPATLVVQELIIRQGDKIWNISADTLQLVTNSEYQWQVDFTIPLLSGLKDDKPVDLALEVDDQGNRNWLVDKKVQIDKVY